MADETARIFPDGKTRCAWVPEGDPTYIAYHDQEWGAPVHEDAKLYEMFVLELFQAGLSWSLLLHKRENFRQAFADFDIDAVCAMTDDNVERLMQDAGIVRNRKKIEATVSNSRIFRTIQREFGSFDAYIWGFTDGETIRENPGTTKSILSDTVSRDLKRRGVKFAGSVTIFSYLQAVGIINSHAEECFCNKQ